MAYEKYKDAIPEDTIARIQRIYQEKLDLTLDLCLSKRSDNIYSATLSDRRAHWNTCGKGTTDLFCSASAYGESMEHICNYFAYDLSVLSEEAKHSNNFERYPDEVLLPVSTLANNPDMMLDIRQAYGRLNKKNISDDDLLKLWSEFLGRETTPFVPYYSVKSGSFRLIPDELVFFLCGSNGGGAGNTPEEAIGHGCDEILERFVKYEIYSKQLTPPAIPRSHLQEICPELLDTIIALEEQTGFSVIVKDASLGKSFSVLAVALINQSASEYLVNFGAHPRFEIALERCLTELFQAFSPGKKNPRKQMEKWSSATEKRCLLPQNWVTLLKDDSGAVPTSFFMDIPSWEFTPWKGYDNDYTNKLGMEIQIKQLLTIAPDVYIHDASYLGFPVFRVYVPTVSSSHVPFDEFQLECYRMMERFPQITKDCDFTKKNLQAIERTLFNPDTFVNGLIFRSIGESRFHLLHAALCYDLGMDDNAIDYLNLARTRYDECLIRKIELAHNGYSAKSIDHLLDLFYKKDISAFAQKWVRLQAFKSTLQMLQADGVTFSARMMTSEDTKLATDSLHIRIKNIMMEDLRTASLADVLGGVRRDLLC